MVALGVELINTFYVNKHDTKKYLRLTLKIKLRNFSLNFNHFNIRQKVFKFAKSLMSSQ